jgi:hypothetical protein
MSKSGRITNNWQRKSPYRKRGYREDGSPMYYEEWDHKSGEGYLYLTQEGKLFLSELGEPGRRLIENSSIQQAMERAKEFMEQNSNPFEKGVEKYGSSA